MKYATIDLSTKRGTRAVEWQAEAPQVESVEELVTFAGDADKALEWINGHLAIDAGNAGRPRVREAEESESDQDAIAAAQARTKEYQPRGVRVGTGTASKAKALDQIRELQSAGKLDNDALAAILAKFGA